MPLILNPICVFVYLTPECCTAICAAFVFFECEWCDVDNLVLIVWSNKLLPCLLCMYSRLTLIQIYTIKYPALSS